MQTTGNTVLITGAGTGMGLAAAQLFAARGNKVLMVARDQQRLEREAARLDGAGPYACDISDPAQVDGLLAHIDEHYTSSRSGLVRARSSTSSCASRPSRRSPPSTP